MTCTSLPLLIVVHEVGHALPALLLTPGAVTVELGRGEVAWHGRVGRLTIAICPKPRPAGIRGSWLYLGWRRLALAGRTIRESAASPLRTVAFLLGGPLASLALAIGCVELVRLALGVIVWRPWSFALDQFCTWVFGLAAVLPWLYVLGGLALASAILGAGSLWPQQFSTEKAREWGAPGTDGWQALYLLRQAMRRSHERARFDRFTPRMRTVIKLTGQEATRLGHAAVTPDHILLAVLREGHGIAVGVIEALGVGPAQLMEALAADMAPHDAGNTVIALSAESKTVIEKMVEEARQLGHHRIGTEHALLGLLAEGQSLAARALVERGVTLERARAAVEVVVRHGDAAHAS